MIKRAYFFTKSFLGSLIFPRICVGCGKDIRWICDECLQKIDIIKQPFCPECRRPTEVGEFCDYCREKFHLDGVFICANFGEGVLKEAIHQFKYDGIFDIGGILGKIMAGKLNYCRERRSAFPTEFDLIIPVPLHKKRFRQRGFNQSEILARWICNAFGRDTKVVVSTGILKRAKFTVPQAELDREQRLDNLKEVFVVVGAIHELPLRDKNILLVDDITTTGTTLEECAHILKQNGAKSVWGIVLAKGK